MVKEKVFTARYGLGLYIKRSALVFKGLNDTFIHMISKAKIGPWQLPDIFLQSTFIANMQTGPGQCLDYRLECPRFKSQHRQEAFPFSKSFNTLWGSNHPPIQSLTLFFSGSKTARV